LGDGGGHAAYVVVEHAPRWQAVSGGFSPHTFYVAKRVVIRGRNAPQK